MGGHVITDLVIAGLILVVAVALSCTLAMLYGAWFDRGRGIGQQPDFREKRRRGRGRSE